MIKTQIKEKYAKLSTEEKCRFLSGLLHDLTIFSREFYDSSTKIKLATINEISHVLSGELGKLLKADENRYPDEVLIDIIFEKNHFFPDGSCELELQMAIERAFTWL